MRNTLLLLIVLLFCCLAPVSGQEQALVPAEGGFPWWGWALLLFGFSFLLGIIAVITGVGGGVLFVPIIGAIFPFHFDFVRGAGIMVALCGSLSAAPKLLGSGLGSIKLAFPLTLMVSLGSIIGALIGLAVPEQLVKLLLGVTILGIVFLMMISKGSAVPDIRRPDPLTKLLDVAGSYYDKSEKKDIHWTIRRLPLGMILFLGIGFFAGMFGLGAGWANVPAMNMFLGAPLKVSVATSGFIISMNSPAWVYLYRGAVLPLITVPSVAGMMLGTRLGAKLLPGAKPSFVRWAVTGILLLSGVKGILEGAGIWV